MKIHHLNCGTLCPLCARLINGTGTWTESGKLVCHCLLIEQESKLILVDTGIGLADIQQADQRLGKSFQKTFKPKLDVNETAHHQIQGLGFSPADVTDIFPTHLDLDHIGGLTDFPQATVHVYQPELEQILKPGLKEKFRFRLNQFDPKPNWKIYQQSTEQWFGLPAFSIHLKNNMNIWMIPLIGHTKGHVGIAIQQDSGTWLLHCGDAYYHHSQLNDVSHMPIGLNIFEKSVQSIRQERLKSLEKLRQLKANHGDEIEFFCAHDPVELLKYQSSYTV